MTKDIGRNMTIADKYFKLYLKEELQPYGLNAAEAIVLLMLYQKESCLRQKREFVLCGNTQDELIRELHYDKGVMTRTMKGLEEKGYVKRNMHPTDSRSFLFTLTEKGRDFRSTIMNILKVWDEIMFRGIGEEQLKEFSETLTIISKNTSSYFAKSSLQKRKQL